MRQLKVFGLAFAVVLSTGLLTVGTADAENTPDQIAFRNNYNYKINRKTREIRDQFPNKARTSEENQVINRHWNQAYRAIRIRELAQDDGDQPTVNRVDGYLARLDADYEVKLRDAISRAPDRSNSPKLLWPVNGSYLSMSRSYSVCRFEYDPQAVSYSCILEQPQTGHRHNYFCSRSGECYGDVNDGRFVNGPARIIASKYIQDQYWSASTVVNVTLGGQVVAAPTIVSPTAGSSIDEDRPFTVRFGNVANATRFQCGIRQGYRTVVRESTNPVCVLAPKEEMIPGSAEVWGSAFVGDRWSETVRVPITLTSTSMPKDRGHAPFIVSPRPGANLFANRPFVCRTDEYPGATGYRCTIRQGKHITNNTAMGYAATSVTVTPSDFETGPAEVVMEVITADGRKTDPAHVRVNIVR